MAKQNKTSSDEKGPSLHLAASAARPRHSQYAEKIRALRIAADMNQGELAKELGVTKNAVTNWETGYSRPDIDTLVKMCAVLSVSADEILSITDHGKRPTETEMLFLQSYRGLNQHDRFLIDKLIDTMHEDEYREFRRTFKVNFTRRPISPLSACAGTGVDLSGGGEPRMILLRNIDETRDCDEIIAITGDSMEPDFHSGDRVLVEHTSEINPGEVGIFVVAGEGLIKVYQKDGLHSINPAYQTIRPVDDDDPRCIGRVLGVLTSEMLPSKRELAMVDEINAEHRR